MTRHGQRRGRGHRSRLAQQAAAQDYSQEADVLGIARHRPALLLPRPFPAHPPALSLCFCVSLSRSLCRSLCLSLSRAHTLSTHSPLVRHPDNLTQVQRAASSQSVQLQRGRTSLESLTAAAPGSCDASGGSRLNLRDEIGVFTTVQLRDEG